MPSWVAAALSQRWFDFHSSVPTVERRVARGKKETNERRTEIESIRTAAIGARWERQRNRTSRPTRPFFVSFRSQDVTRTRSFICFIFHSRSSGFDPICDSQSWLPIYVAFFFSNHPRKSGRDFYLFLSIHQANQKRDHYSPVCRRFRSATQG